MDGETIKVRVSANAKRDEVREEAGYYKVYLTAPPVEGKANKRLLDVLSDYFHVRKSQSEIVKGEKSKEKLIRIWRRDDQIR